MGPNIKQELYRLCRKYVRDRIEASRRAIAEAQQSANEETKSSSGDKYETARAMMQLEIEKNSQQLSEALKLEHALDQIRIDNAPASAQPGSLVVTDHGVFFMAISMGKVILHETAYVVISPASPLGQKLLGLRTRETVTFRDQRFVVQELM